MVLGVSVNNGVAVVVVVVVAVVAVVFSFLFLLSFLFFSSFAFAFFLLLCLFSTYIYIYTVYTFNSRGLLLPDPGLGGTGDALLSLLRLLLYSPFFHPFILSIHSIQLP